MQAEVRNTKPEKNNCLPERIFGIDFARSICALIIIAFHYACHTTNENKIFYATRTSGWGDIAVTVFFIISGAALYHVYPSVKSLKTFWYKRWKSIFPMFYLCFVYFYIQNVFQSHTLVYGPSPLSLLFTVFGMDGYLLYRYQNYYIIGEWFLGAIILLYLLYPAIVWVMKKTPIAMPVILVAGYAIVLGTDVFMIPSFRNLFTCMASFYVGILVLKYRAFFFNNVISLFLATGIFIWLTFFPFPFDLGDGAIVLEQIHGTVFLIILVRVGELIRQFKISKLFAWISKMSFPVFLLHHKLILNIQGVYDPQDIVGEICMLVLTIIMTLICAKILTIINQSLLNSKRFSKLDYLVARKRGD